NEPQKKALLASYDSLKFGNYILTNDSKIDLNDLSIMKRTGVLPRYIDKQTGQGGLLGHTHDWQGTSLHCLDKDGNSSEIAKTNLQTPIIQLGNHGWFLGTASLQRVSLNDCSLDPKNYFENTRLLIGARMAWAQGDFLRIEGTGADGKPRISYLTPEGHLVFVEHPTVPLEHPVEIQWNL
ncbi:MAG: hypothetical protein HY537_15925, partial [Deltaproteobacteria bacterium]|nr:hypothetical protein [Deltaproteobacteria bacterium]